MKKKSLSVPALFLAAILFLLGAYLIQAENITTRVSEPAPIAPQLSINNIELRAPAPGQSIATIFMDIKNTGGSDRLLSISSDISERIELHTHLHENGLMKMRKVENITIPANGTHSLKSGADHIMIFDYNPIAGTTAIALSLNFERSGEKRVIAVVK